jgi:hypothetical protein
MFATLSDMFSGGKNLPRWSWTVAAMMESLQLLVELDGSPTSGDQSFLMDSR